MLNILFLPAESSLPSFPSLFHEMFVLLLLLIFWIPREDICQKLLNSSEKGDRYKILEFVVEASGFIKSSLSIWFHIFCFISL